MSEHIEWADAGYAIQRLAVLDHDEAVENLAPDVEEEVAEAVLCLDTGSSVMAIEGTYLELLELAHTISDRVVLAGKAESFARTGLNIGHHVQIGTGRTDWVVSDIECWAGDLDKVRVSLKQAQGYNTTSAEFARLTKKD